MAQEYSIVETFDNMSGFTWRDEWLVIAVMPPRKGELDYEQESFRLSYNNYLKNIAMKRESIEADILATTMHGMLHATPDAEGYYDMPQDSDPFGDPRTPEEIQAEIATYEPGYVWSNPFEHDGTPDCQCGDCYRKKDPWFHPHYDSMSDCSEY